MGRCAIQYIKKPERPNLPMAVGHRAALTIDMGAITLRYSLLFVRTGALYTHTHTASFAILKSRSLLPPWFLTPTPYRFIYRFLAHGNRKPKTEKEIDGDACLLCISF
jgi:hypothetical protein